MSVRSRPTARVILLDGEGRILLFRFHEEGIENDPRNRSGLPFLWCTPGGGVNQGESFEDAARRELWEETGFDQVELGPWLRSKEVLFMGEARLFEERYFLARAPESDVLLHNLEPAEQVGYREHRWWSAAEIRQSNELIFPEGLGNLLAPIAAGIVPTAPIRVE